MNPRRWFSVFGSNFGRKPAVRRGLSDASKYLTDLERLEDRLAPATFNWKTVAADGAWNNPANWTLVGGADNGVSGIPDAGDDAQFTAPSNFPTVNLATPITLTNLTLGGTAAGFRITGAGLTVSAVTDQSSGANTITSNLSGAGGVTKSGAGILTLSGNNTYAGSTTVNGGTLKASRVPSANLLAYYSFDNAGNLGQDSSGNGNNGTLVGGTAASPAGHIGGAIDLTTFNGYLQMPNLASSFSGQAATMSLWVKLTNATPSNGTRTGLMDLGTGSNTHYPWVDGTSYVNTFRNTRVDSIALDPGIDRTQWGLVTIVNDPTDLAAGWRMYQNTTLIRTAAPSWNISGFRLGEQNGFFVDGYLDEARLYNRALSASEIAALYLDPGPANIIPDASPVVVANGATFAVDDSETIGSLSTDLPTSSAAQVVVSNGALTTGGLGTNTTFAGVVSGLGGLTKAGTGTLILSGNSTYTGVTTISAGTLQLGAGGTSGAIAGASIVNNASLVVNRSDTFTIGPSISGTGSLTQAGTGVTVLARPNTYTGATNVSAGTLRLNNYATIPVSSQLQEWFDASNAASVIQSGGKVTQWNDLTGNGRNLVQGNAASQPTLAANVLNGRPVVRFDGNDVIANAYNSATPYTIITVSKMEGTQNRRLLTATANNWLLGYWNGDMDQLYADGVVRLGGGPAANTSLHFYGATGTGAVSSLYDGTTLLASNGGGLTAPNGISLGAWQNNPGSEASKGDVAELVLYDRVLTPAEYASVIDYLTLKWVGGNFISDSSAVNVAAGATFDVNGAGEGIGSLANSGSVTVGGGSLTVNGNASIAGSVSLAGGTMTVNGTLSGAGSISVGGGNLVVNGSITGTVAISLGGGALTVNETSDSTFSGAVSGAGSLTKTGAANLTLSGINTYTGTTTVSAGTLTASGGSALPDASAVTLSPGATLSVASSETIGSLTGSGTVTVAAGQTVSVGSDNTNSAFSGVITGAGSLAKVGTGTLTLSGPNTYGGTTTAAAGVLKVSHAPTDNLLAYYTFDNAGNLGQDSSGNGNNGVLNGTAVATAAGHLNGALDLTAANGYVQMPNLAGSFGGQAASVSLWVKLTLATPTDTARTGLMDLGSGSNTHFPWVDGTAYLNTFRNTRVDSIALSPSIDRTQWELVTIVNDPTDLVTGWRMYQNTTLIRTAAPSFSISGFQLGHQNGYFVDGYLDEARLYNRALSAADIQAIFDDAGPVNVIPDGSPVIVTNTGTFQITDNETVGSLSTDLPSSSGASLLVSGGSLTSGGLGTSTTFAGVVSGNGGLTKVGAGTLTLSGNNTYTGPTTISAGAVQVGSGGATGSLASASVVNNASLIINRSGTMTLSSAVSGTGSLTQAGTGVTILTGANTYTGATNVDAGTLRLGTPPTLTVTSGLQQMFDASNPASIVQSGGLITQWNDVSGNARNLSQGNAAFQPTLFPTAINGRPAVRFDGNDAIGNNYNPGTPYTIITVSKMQGTQNGRLITAVNNNWLLGYWNNNQDQLYAEGSVRLGGGPVPNTSVHFYGATGDGSVSSLYDGTTLIASNGGGLAPPAGLSLGAAGNNGGSEPSKGDVGEVLLYNRVLTPAEYASVVSYLTAKWTFPASLLSDTSPVIVAPGATFDVNGGTETIGPLTDNGNVTVGGGVLTVSGTLTGTGAIALGGGSLIVNETSDSTFGGNISGAGNVVKNGAANLTLAGTNTYTGTTSIAAGTLTVAGGSAAPDSSAVAISSGATLAVAASETIGSIAGTGTMTVAAGATASVGSNNSSTTFGGAITGAGSLTKVGTGVLTLAGTNTYGGTTTAAAGVLKASHAPSDNLLAYYTFDNSGNLGQDSSGNGNNGAISGTGFFSASGHLNGALDLTAAAGSLLMPNLAGSFGAQAATLTVWVKLTLATPTDGARTGFVDLGSGSNTHYPWVDGQSYQNTFRTNRVDGIALSGSIDRTQWHMVTIVNDPTDLATGWRMYQNTTLIRTAAPAFGISGFQLGRQNAFFLDGYLDEARLYNRALSAADIQAVFDDAGPVNIIPDASPVIVAAGATFEVGDNETIGSLATDLPTSSTASVKIDSGTLTTGGTGASTTFAGVISGTALTKVGAGTMILTGNNTYTGLTTISGGVLQIGAGGTSGTMGAGASAVNDAAVVINRSDTYTLGVAISGTGSFTQAGTGVTILAGGNTYTGPTNVNAGTLRLATPPTLPSIAGLQERFDAFNSSSIVQSGGLVTQWNDLSGNARNLSQGNTAFQPTLFPTAINGHPAVRFDGNDAIGNAYNPGTPYTIITVSRMQGTQNQRLITANNNWLLGFWGGNQDQLYAEGVVRLGGGPVPDTNVHFYGATGDGAVSSLYDRTTLIASNGGGVAPPDGLSLGAWQNNGGSEASKGDVGEVLLYNRVLTPAEYASVVSYLTAKWTFPASLISDVSTVTVAAGATFDLAGVPETVGPIAGAGAITLGAGVLTVNETVDSAFSGGISGTGNVVKSGPANLTLSGTNTYTGTTTVSAGTLTATGGSALPDASAVTVAPSGTLSIAASETIGSATGTGTVTVAAGQTVSIGADNTSTTFAGTITGAGSLTKVGAGTLTLAGTNTYGGTTTVAAGLLKASHAPSDNLVAYYTFDNSGNLGQDSSGNGANGTFSGTAVFSAAGHLNGALDLTAANGYLQMPNLAGAFGGQAATLTLWVKLTLATPTDGARTGLVNLGSGSNTHYPWVDGQSYQNTFRTNRVDGIALSGTIDRSQWHMVTIVNDPTDLVTGWRMYQNTTLIRTAAPAFGISGFQLGQQNGFFLDGYLDEARLYSRALNLADIQAVFADAGPVNIIPDGSPVIVANGATFEVGDSETIGSLATDLPTSTTASVKIDSGTLTTGGNNASTTFAGVISGTALTKAGTGTMVLSGNNTYTGLTTISAGALQIGAGGTSGTIGTNPSAIDNGTLIVNRSDTYTLAVAVSGSGGLTQAGTGVTILTKGNTYTGPTNVDAGTLRIGTPPTLSVLGQLQEWFDASNTASIVQSGGLVTQWNDISGNARHLTQGAAGSQPTLALTAVNGHPAVRFDGNDAIGNAYAPGTPYTIITVSQMQGTQNQRLITANNNWLLGFWGGNQDQLYAEGVVRLGGGPAPDTNVHYYGATGDGSISSLFDGTSLIASNNGGVAPPVGLSLGAWQNNGGNEASKGDVAEVLLYNRILTPAEYASVVAYLTAKWTFPASLISDVSPVTVAAGATFDLNGAAETVGTIAGAGAITLGAGALTANQTANTTFSGPISGAGTMTKIASGTLTLSGPNSYGGLTTVSAGTLVAANNTALGVTSSPTVVAAAGTLALAGGVVVAEPVTFAGAVGVDQLANISGTNSLTGPVTLGVAPTVAPAFNIRADAGQLTVTSNLTNTAAYQVHGAGATVLSGVVGNNTYASVNTAIIAGSGNYWRLGESSGTTAVDAVGGMNATYTSATLGQPGALFGDSDTAAGFNGTNAYVTLPSAAFNNIITNSPISLAVWFKTTSHGIIVGQTGGGTPGGGGPAGHVPTIYVGTDGKLYSEFGWAGAVDPIITAGTVNDGNWHFAVTTYAPNSRNLYLDGALVGTRTQGQASFNGNVYSWWLGTGYDAGWPAGTGWHFFNGSIDEAAVYNSNLTPAQISQIYNVGIAGSPASLTKYESGTLTLSGNNTYSGGTIINGGSLLANNATSSTGSAAVDVNSGGTLGGTGKVTGAVNVHSGGTLAPGTSPGVLDVGNTVTFDAGSFFSVDINGPTAGTDYDQLKISGAGNLSIAPGAFITGSTGYQPTNGTTYLVINKTSSGSSSGTFTSFDNFPVGGSPGTVDIGGKTYTTNYNAAASPNNNNQSLMLNAVPATRVWDGGGLTDNWSDAANWVGDDVNDKPFMDDAIIFDDVGIAHLNSVKDALFVPTRFSTLTLDNTTGTYNITGGSAEFTGGVTATNCCVGFDTLGINLTGSAGVVVNDGGLILTGTNTYTGATSISGTLGVLIVDGSITSDTSVAASAYLSGTGTITGNVSGAGFLDPGDYYGLVTGTLTVVGDVTVANMNYDVLGPADFDQLNVSGVIDLSGTSLTFAGSPGSAPALPNFITFIANDLGDPIITNGSTTPASGATVTIGGVPFKLFYNAGDGNDAILVDASAPAVAYVSPTWSALTPGTVIADADFGTPGSQPAIFGVNAFLTINAALGAITASGQVIVNSGVYSEAVALTGTRTFTVTGSAAVTVNSYSSVAGSSTQINAGGTFTLGDGTNTAIDVISGAGALVKQGAGTVTLGAANTYSGGTTINNGTLVVNGSLAAGTVTVNAGTLAGSGTIGGSVVATGTGRVSPGTDTVIANLTVSGDLSLLGTSTLYIQINGLVAWDTITVGGVVTINASGATLSGATIAPQLVGSPAFAVIDGGTGFVGTFQNATAQPTVAVGGRNYTYTYTGPTAYDFLLASAPSDVEWSGGGITNNWSEGANWVGGAPAFGDNLIFGNVGIGKPATFNDFPANSLFGIRIINNSGTYTLDGAAVTLGAIGLVESGAGGAAVANIALAGSSGVAVSAGALTLGSSANSYAGNTNVSGGSLTLGASNVIPDGAGKGNVSVDGTLNVNGFTDTLNALTGTGVVDNTAGAGHLIIGNTNGSFTFSGVLQNTGGTLSLTKIGSGAMTLAGAAANTATGTTTVVDGTLALAKTGGQSVAGPVVIGDGDNNLLALNIKTAILRVDTNNQVGDASSITLADDGRLFITAAAAETITTPIAFAAGDVKIAGTLITTNAYDQPTGTTTLSGGTLRVGAAGTLNSSLGTSTTPGGTLQGSGTIYTNILTSWGTIDPSSGLTDADFGNASAGRITIRGNLQMTASSTTNLDVAPAGSDQLNVGINTALALPAGSYTNLSNYDLDPYLRGDVASVTEPGRRGVNDLYNINGTVRFNGTLNTRPIQGNVLMNNVTYGNSMNFVWRALNLPMGGFWGDLNPKGGNLSSVPSDFTTKNSLDVNGLPTAAVRFDPRFMGSGGQFNAVGQSVGFVTKFMGNDQAGLTAPAYSVGQAKELTLTSLTSSAAPDAVVKVTKQLWNAMKDSHTRVTLTITNTGATAATGPIYVELVGIPAGATAFNAAGKRPSTGKPYLVVPAASLAAGAAVTMEVDLLTPVMLGKTAALTLQVLRGGMP